MNNITASNPATELAVVSEESSMLANISPNAKGQKVLTFQSKKEFVTSYLEANPGKSKADGAREHFKLKGDWMKNLTGEVAKVAGSGQFVASKATLTKLGDLSVKYTAVKNLKAPGAPRAAKPDTTEELVAKLANATGKPVSEILAAMALLESAKTEAATT